MALIVALVLTFAAVGAAAALATAQSHTLRRTQSLMASDRAWELLRAIELAVVADLQGRLVPGRAAPPAEWTLTPAWLEEGGVASARVVDLQARLNLNSLHSVVEDGGRQDNALEIDRFSRLLGGLGVSMELVDSILDWLDGDGAVRTKGAEDDYYSRLQPAYRAANGALAHPSELLLVRGVTPDAYARLQPYVATLAGRQPLNVNTAPEAVLLALDPDLTRIDITGVMDARAQRAFERLEDFYAVGNVHRAGVSRVGLSTRSRYYLIESLVQVDRVHLRVASVLDVAESAAPKVVQRTVGGY